jgi:hypothetical protein
VTGRRNRVALLSALALALLFGAAAPVAAAGSISFGDPSASAVFGNGITFSQPVTASGLEARYVEIMITRPGSAGAEVHTIAQVGNITASTFEYSLREQDGHLYPNTRFVARWRVVDTAGGVHVGPQTSVTYIDTRFQWRSATGKLVRVHWYKGDDAFGQRALAISEAGVAKAEELFGVTETEPIDFYVYSDIPAFYGALGPGTRENVGGEALPEIRTLFALITPDQISASWVGIVIPHELTHLVFDTAVHNPYHFPPRWFNEGLAVYLTQGNDPSDRGLVRDAVNAGDIIPLSGLAGQFPTQRDKFGLAYAESVSAIDFLVRRYGSDALVKLVRSYQAGVTDDAAFKGALGVDTGGFNDAWLADIGAREPVTQGPRPDPAGPLPSGWSSSPAPAASGSLTASASPSPSASAAPATGVPAGSGALPPPTLVLAPTPVAPSAPEPGASVTPLVTPGVIAEQPPVTRASNVGLAWLFGALAILLAALGLGLIAFRRHPAEPR